MSLKVWLPLDGDLRNLGTNNITVHTNSATVNTSGKIGSCYYYNGSQYSIFTPAVFNNSTSDWSYCCWFKPVNSHNGCLFSNRSAVVNTAIAIFYYSSQIIFDDGVRWQFTPSTAITVGQWNHLAFVKRKGVGKYFYLNGVLINSTTTTGTQNNSSPSAFSIGNSQQDSTTVGGNPLNGYLNDVRIYDHALSAAEVKEISQGLVLHYKLDGCMGGSGENLFTNTNRWYTATSAAFANTSGYPAVNFTKDLQQLVGKTICFSFEVYTPGTRTDGSGSLGNRFGAHLSLNYTPSGGSATQAYPCASHLTDTIVEEHYRVFSTYTVPSNCTINSFSMAIQPFAKPGDDNTAIWKLGQFKVEFGDKPTNYSPAPIDLGIDQTCIVDSSGYSHNGSTLGDVKISSDTTRYQSSIDLLTASTAINCGRGGMVTDSITVNMWLKSSAWNNPASCTEGGGWNFEASGDYFRFPIYISGVGYKYGQSATTKAQLCNNQWHMLTGIYDRINQKVQIYVDGKLDNDYAAGTSNNIGYHGSNVVWIGAEASGSNTAPNNYGMRGLFSDFRIYCTALSADDILTLYHTSARIDNLQNIHTYEYIEGNTSTKLTKQGQLKTIIAQEAINQSLAYDQTLYTEPDGSTWIHIFHHNNPAEGRFSGASGDWSTGVYIDTNRWYNVEAFFNDTLPYEFMIKQKTTSDATETKYRWIQTPNPLTATWTDVKPGTVTFITTTGYSNSSYGGMYLMKSGNLHMCIANGSNGNWFGGIGAAGTYNGGIPGYPNTTVTSGYIDLFLRIYPTAKIINNIGIGSNNLLET